MSRFVVDFYPSTIWGAISAPFIWVGIVCAAPVFTLCFLAFVIVMLLIAMVCASLAVPVICVIDLMKARSGTVATGAHLNIWGKSLNLDRRTVKRRSWRRLWIIKSDAPETDANYRRRILELVATDWFGGISYD